MTRIQKIIFEIEFRKKLFIKLEKEEKQNDLQKGIIQGLDITLGIIKLIK